MLQGTTRQVSSMRSWVFGGGKAVYERCNEFLAAGDSTDLKKAYKGEELECLELEFGSRMLRRNSINHLACHITQLVFTMPHTKDFQPNKTKQ